MSRTEIAMSEAGRSDHEGAISIVVVDDEPDNRDMLVACLTGERLRPIGVATGQDALEHVRREEVDVVILDLHLGREDGAQIARELRADERTSCIALVAVSGVVDPDWRIVRHFDAYLRKPIVLDTLPDLCLTLAGVTRRERARRASAQR